MTQKTNNKEQITKNKEQRAKSKEQKIDKPVVQQSAADETTSVKEPTTSNTSTSDIRPSSVEALSASLQPTTNPPALGQWYVVHTYSGHENKAAEALKQRIETMNLGKKIFEVIVPTRNIVLVRHGKKQETKEKIFPGYIIVRMTLDDESWLAVRTTPGVTAFVGAGNKPTAISDKEVEAIMRFSKLEAPKFKTKYSKGEAVKIIDGPFADFLGTVEAIDEDKGKVKVLISIFGRETPVELDFLQVAKL